MKLDLTKPLKREDWMKKEDKVEPLAYELKKLVYGGVGIKQNEDPMRRADEMYGYYKLFKELDHETHSSSPSFSTKERWKYLLFDFRNFLKPK